MQTSLSRIILTALILGNCLVGCTDSYIYQAKAYIEPLPPCIDVCEEIVTHERGEAIRNSDLKITHSLNDSGDSWTYNGVFKSTEPIKYVAIKLECRQYKGNRYLYRFKIFEEDCVVTVNMTHTTPTDWETEQRELSRFSMEKYQERNNT